MNAMIASQNSGLTGIQEVGFKLALANGVSEGIDTLQQDLASLDRLTTAGAVSVNALIQLAAGLNPLGSQRVLPIPPLTTALFPTTWPSQEFEMDQTSARPGDVGYRKPVRDLPRPQRSTPAQAKQWSNRETAGLELEGHEPGTLSISDRVAAPTDLPKPYPPTASRQQPTVQAQESMGPVQEPTAPAQEPTAPTLRPTTPPAAQVSPDRPGHATAPYDAMFPVDPIPAKGAKVNGVLPELDRNAEIRSTIATPSRPAHLSTMRTAPMAKGFGTSSIAPALAAPTPAHSTAALASQPDPTLETIMALAHSLESMMAVPAAAPTITTALRVAPTAPRTLPPQEPGRGQVMSNGAPRPPPRSRPLPESAIEPRQGLLILDGAQLGRWIMDSIARQATRPAAGATGIDPRITPVFPGAPMSA